MHRDLEDGLIVVTATIASSVSSVKVRILHGIPQSGVWREEQSRDRCEKSRAETDAIFCERRSKQSR